LITANERRAAENLQIIFEAAEERGWDVNQPWIYANDADRLKWIFTGMKGMKGINFFIPFIPFIPVKNS